MEDKFQRGLVTGDMLRTYFQNIFVEIIFATLKISHNFKFKAVVRLTFTLLEKNVNTNTPITKQLPKIIVSKPTTFIMIYQFFSIFYGPVALGVATAIW